MNIHKITSPLSLEIIENLHTGDKVLLSGKIYTARDAAHKKLVDLISNEEELPIELKNNIIYYCGPTPTKPGYITGAIGPTTSGRMDSFTPLILEKGLKGMIGKGKRSLEVRASIVKHKAVYLAALGGAGALIAECVKSIQLVAYPELGPEAIYELYVEDFPLIVVNDIFGNDLYEGNGSN